MQITYLNLHICHRKCVCIEGGWISTHPPSGVTIGLADSEIQPRTDGRPDRKVISKSHPEQSSGETKIAQMSLAKE